MTNPHERLRHHVTGAIDRGEKTAIVEQPADRLASAKSQGQAQFDSIKEMIDALDGWQAAGEAEGWTGPHKDKFGATYFEQTKDGERITWCCADWVALCAEFGIEPDQHMIDDARQAIEDDALSIEVRSEWHQPGSIDDPNRRPAEYRILLCTGGPAVQITGGLDDYCQPQTARMQVQDWFTPWTDFRPQVSPENFDSEPILLAYARVFWFGE
jgi:hypothetical protein